MANTTSELINFLVKIGFDDLPTAVVEEAKRVLLDSVGCALGGLATEKGRIALRFGRSLGGPPEATILGVSDKVGCSAAAFINGELINALDYDALLIPPTHVSPYVIPAPLAVAEKSRASGRELLLSIALGHEVAFRMASGLVRMRSFVKEGPERGSMEKPPVMGLGMNIFGAVIASGKILGLNRERMADAFGNAGHFCPAPQMTKWFHTAPCPMGKYLSSGLVSQTAVNAAMLADMGYKGDRTVLDGDYGLWRFFSSPTWRPDIVLRGLGQQWGFLFMAYKKYPCCGCMHGGLDLLFKIIQQNHLLPEDIEKVRALMDPWVALPVWRDNRLENHVDAQFNVPYVFAVGAYTAAGRITLGPEWQSPGVITNPDIRRFMEKVSFDAHPEYGKRVLEDPRCNLSEVEVIAKGRAFREVGTYFRGASYPESARLTTEELIKKFHRNASGVLSASKINGAIKAIFELDRLDDVSHLMETLVP